MPLHILFKLSNSHQMRANSRNGIFFFFLRLLKNKCNFICQSNLITMCSAIYERLLLYFISNSVCPGSTYFIILCCAIVSSFNFPSTCIPYFEKKNSKFCEFSHTKPSYCIRQVNFCSSICLVSPNKFHYQLLNPLFNTLHTDN